MAERIDISSEEYILIVDHLTGAIPEGSDCIKCTHMIDNIDGFATHVYRKEISAGVTARLLAGAALQCAGFKGCIIRPYTKGIA